MSYENRISKTIKNDFLNTLVVFSNNQFFEFVDKRINVNVKNVTFDINYDYIKFINFVIKIKIIDVIRFQIIVVIKNIDIDIKI